MANHTGVLLGTVQKWANGQPDVYIISEEGHKIYTQKLLITFYSHTLNSILNGGFDNEIQGVTIPASSSSIVNLLKVLATGIAITKNKLDLTDVSKTAEAMGISMENWQIGVKNNRAKPSGGQPSSSTNDKNPKLVKKNAKKVADGTMKEEPLEESSQDKIVKKHSCPECGKQFGRKDHLNRHALTHSKSKDALSNQMTKVQDPDYVEDSDLVVHVKQEQLSAEEDRQIESENANQHGTDNNQIGNDQVADDESIITDGMIGEENESTIQEGDGEMSEGIIASKEGDATFPCGQCDKIFKNRTHLTRHEAVHSGIRFDCDKCSSTFSRKDKLNAHMRKKHSQTDDKPSSQDNMVEPESVADTASTEVCDDVNEKINTMETDSLPKFECPYCQDLVEDLADHCLAAHSTVDES